MDDEVRVASAERLIHADAAVIFELIADPARQPEWDGNDNLAEAAPGQRITGIGQTFITRLTMGALRENTVIDFVEGRRIGWMPAEVGKEPFGQRWLWELEPTADPGVTLVRHTYDWTALPAEPAIRVDRARRTTPDKLAASLDRLAALAQTPGS
jgi:uncharacterized protein YndB with AHSA1/START domain